MLFGSQDRPGQQLFVIYVLGISDIYKAIKQAGEAAAFVYKSVLVVIYQAIAL